MRRKQKGSLLLALLLIFLCMFAGGCFLLPGNESDKEEESSQEEPLPEPDPDYPAEAAGAILAARPEKVVSLSPSLTEKIVDLGLENQLAGVSKYDDYPGSVRDLPRCGTNLLPDLEAIGELAPRLVVSAGPLPEDDLLALQQMDIEVAQFPRAESLTGLYDIYRDLAVLLAGRTTGAATAAEKAEAVFEGRLSQIADAVAAAGTREEVPVLFLRQLDFVVATGDSLEGQLMERIGLENIAAAYTGWQYPEDVATTTGRADFEKVRAIFCDGEDVTIKKLEQSGFYKTLPATLQDWFITIDAAAFERQSLRMLPELEKMALYCYPELAGTLPPSATPAPAGQPEDATGGTAEQLEPPAP